MNDAVGPTLDQQIAEIERELAMRRRCYPRWIAEHRMLQKNADKFLAAMEAVLATMTKLKETTCSNSN